MIVNQSFLFCLTHCSSAFCFYYVNVISLLDLRNLGNIYPPLLSSGFLLHNHIMNLF